jgi:tetratricopeptide (TPR) repeat protein
VTAHRIAVESARKAGERLGEAWALNQLGWGLARMHDGESFGHLEQALAIRRELGDTVGEAQTAGALAEGHLNTDGPGEDALRYMRQATGLLRPMGASMQLGAAVNNLGEVYFGLGDLTAAAECYAEARDICREIGGYGEGHALHNLGRVYIQLHRLDDAAASLDEAVRKHRAAGDLSGEAVAFKHFGQLHELTGDLAQARAAWTTAQTIFEQIGDHAQAAETAAAIAALRPPDVSP